MISANADKSSRQPNDPGIVIDIYNGLGNGYPTPGMYRFALYLKSNGLTGQQVPLRLHAKSHASGAKGYVVEILNRPLFLLRTWRLLPCATSGWTPSGSKL